MSVMIRAGLPLIEVLDILGDQTERRSLAEVIRKVEKDVEGGCSLTEAMQKHINLFSVFFVSMIRAGEAAGMLDTILDQVAVYLERIASLQRKIKSAVMYPTVVSIVAFGITIFLLVKVVPVFETIFSDLGGQLPLPTALHLVPLALFPKQMVYHFARDCWPLSDRLADGQDQGGAIQAGSDQTQASGLWPIVSQIRYCEAGPGRFPP